MVWNKSIIRVTKKNWMKKKMEKEDLETVASSGKEEDG